MKKLLLIIALLFAFPVSAASIPEGAIIKTVNNPDVYIVKYLNGYQYKRLVLNPLVFQSYGHLKWENLLTVSQVEMDNFQTSSLVRVDGSSDVYELTPTGDDGSKQKLSSYDWGIDLSSVYIINSVDFGNYTDNGIKHVVSKAEAIETPAINPIVEVVVTKSERIAYMDYVKSKIRIVMDGYEAEVESLKAQIDGITQPMSIVNAKISRLQSIKDGPIGDYIISGKAIPQVDKSYLLSLGIVIPASTEELRTLEDTEAEEMLAKDKQVTINNAYKEITVIATADNKEIETLSKQMDDLTYQMIHLGEGQGVTTDGMAPMRNEIMSKYNPLYARYNILIERKKRLTVIIYEIDDYDNYGELIPAEDRAYLASLGIDFRS